MSNEPTPDTPDADDSVSTPVDPSPNESSGPPPAGEADPTVDVMSDFTPADGDDEDVGPTGRGAGRHRSGRWLRAAAAAALHDGAAGPSPGP